MSDKIPTCKKNPKYVYCLLFHLLVQAGVQDSGEIHSEPEPHHHSAGGWGRSGGPLLHRGHHSGVRLLLCGENIFFFFLKQKLCICLPSSQGCIVTSCVGRSLSVQEPSITDISPDYGPVFGGTTVTLTGTHLNSGVRRDVFIAEKKCLVQRWAVSQGSVSLLVGCNPKVGFMVLWAVSQPFLFFKKGS